MIGCPTTATGGLEHEVQLLAHPRLPDELAERFGSKAVVEIAVTTDTTGVDRPVGAIDTGRPVRIERSTDGLTYSTVAIAQKPGRVTELNPETSARYVSVVVNGWQPGDAELVEVAVLG